jgi:ubiquinone/menaquinone biosynthesis C-methylase UbiE
MGLYARFVVPWLIDVAMNNKDAARLRAEWVPRARGDVLEVGIGSGLNLPFYPPAVHKVYGVDPSLPLQRKARERAAGKLMKGKSMTVEFFLQSAEAPLRLADKSIDTVVVTWSLCSIPSPSAALREMRRVLKPDGRLIFIEHGRAPDVRVARWQDRLTPAWKRIGGGCHLNRKVDDLLTAAGFHIAELKTCYLPGPRPMTYTYQGVADPA